MKLNIFKSLFLSNEKRLKLLEDAELKNKNNQIIKKINSQVDYLIENENYDALMEFSNNGYTLNYHQRRRVAVSFLSFPQGEVKQNKNFSCEKWLKFLDKIKLSDRESFDDILNNVVVLLINQSNIRYMWPFDTEKRADILFHSRWNFPNDTFELFIAHHFVTHFKDDILKTKDEQVLTNIKNNLMSIEISKKEDEAATAIAKSYLDELIIEVSSLLDNKMSTFYKESLDDVRRIFGNKNQNELTNPSIIENHSLPNEKILDPELKAKLESIHEVINAIDKMTLKDEQRLEFNNLVNEKLPKMLNTYLEADVSLRNVVINDESLNTIFANNLDQFKQIVDKIKEGQTQIQAINKINEFKVHSQYLKSKM